jgi:electron transport complex protein RnfB
MMHAVISDLCTGCELCVPACPVDCITLDPMPLVQADDRHHADAARSRFVRREARLGRERAARDVQLATTKTDVAAPTARNAVLEALARAKARKKDNP